jgi:hypothetical protein
MLQHAIALDQDGRAVYVIAANKESAWMIFEMLRALYGGAIALESSMQVGGIKIETPSSPGNFDWELMRLRGAHPNCVTLVDHHAIESRFNRVLAMLHAYDN